VAIEPGLLYRELPKLDVDHHRTRHYLSSQPNCQVRKIASNGMVVVEERGEQCLQIRL
jgi:hypothetical protein